MGWLIGILGGIALGSVVCMFASFILDGTWKFWKVWK